MVKVQVEQGLLEGEQLDLVTGDGQYYSFKGVPYAEPPVGPLRFKVRSLILLENRLSKIHFIYETSIIWLDYQQLIIND